MDDLTAIEHDIIMAYRGFNEEGREKLRGYVDILIGCGYHSKNVTRLKWYRKHKAQNPNF